MCVLVICSCLCYVLRHRCSVNFCCFRQAAGKDAEPVSKWKPVSKEVDWKRETMEKRRELDKRVGGSGRLSERSTAEAKRSGVKPEGGKDADHDVIRDRQRIPTLMSIVTNERRGDKDAELTSPSRKRKLDKPEGAREDARPSKVLDKVSAFPHLSFSHLRPVKKIYCGSFWNHWLRCE